MPPLKKKCSPKFTHFELPSPEKTRPECELFGKSQNPEAPHETSQGRSIVEWVELDRPDGPPASLKFLKAGNATFSQMVEQATTDPKVGAAIRHKLVRQWQYFFYHMAEAKGASAEAAVQTAMDIITSLNEYSFKNQKEMRSVSGKFALWPARCSHHPKLRDEVDDVFSKLKIGKKLPFIVDKSARWNPSDPCTKIALRLAMYVQELRQNSTEWSEMHPDKAFIAEAGKLEIPSPGSDDVQNWWMVARAAFEASFPEPETTPELRELITAKSHLISEATIRFRLIRKIENRFKSLFGYKNPKRNK